MKTLLLIICFGIAVTSGLRGQGQLTLDNFGNASMDTSATSNGLFWISSAGSAVLINQDFNAAFYLGTSSTSLKPLAIFLLSNGTAAGDKVFPGIFSDPTGAIYTIPGATISVFMQIEAWTGNFNSYAAALAGGAAAAQSPIFKNQVDVPPGPVSDLTGMPAMVLSGIPEPTTVALAALGGLSALMRRRPRR